MFCLPLKNRYSIPLSFASSEQIFHSTVCLPVCFQMKNIQFHCLSFHLPLEKQIFHSVVCLSICFLIITNIQFQCLSLCLPLEKQIFHSIGRLPICFLRTNIPFHYLHFHLLREDKSSIPLFAFSSASRGQIFYSIICIFICFARTNISFHCSSFHQLLTLHL